MAAPLPRALEQRVDDLEAMLQHVGVSPPYVLLGLSSGWGSNRRTLNGAISHERRADRMTESGRSCA
jgi:hypothetical protein